MLLQELIAKTSCRYEILLWLNVQSEDFQAHVLDLQMQDVPVRVVGITPENIGMHAYRELFLAAQYDIITQIDDDVTRLSYKLAEGADALFRKHPQLLQVVADVWQDDWTTGSRPAMNTYQAYSKKDGLYRGLVDGWFSMYHRSMLPILMQVPYKKYEFIGSWASYLLNERGLRGLLCTQMKVFHVAGPAYAELFGQLDAEIEKYRSVDREDIVEAYGKLRPTLPPLAVLQQGLDRAYADIDHHHEKMTILDDVPQTYLLR
jgi:hypothetical protein